MDNQPFDDYKNYGVEYDYIIEATVSVKAVHTSSISEIINLLKNEDFVKIYFKEVALGRVYGKVILKLDNTLYFKFGISLVDSDAKITSKALIKDVNEFILALNKNVATDSLNINKGDINVDIITENKNIIDYDKVLVNEGKLYFNKDTDKHLFKMTDDGVVEHYHNDNLTNSFPFAKLTLTRECKSLIQDNYIPTILTEDMNDNAELKKDVLDNPNKVKQDIQNSIDAVDEIQAKQDELNDKLDNLLGESKSDNYPEFPSNEFTEEPVIYDDLNVETFNEYLTAEQKAYINAYIGTIDEFVQAMQLLYDEVGDGVAPLISVNDYVKEILEYDGGIDEWTQEMSDLLGYDIKTEGKEFDNIEKEVRKIASEKGLDTSDKAIKTIMKDIIDNFYNGTDVYSNGDINEDKIRNIIIPAMDTYYGIKVGDNLNLKTEAVSKFYTVENAFEDFLKTAKEETEDGYYEFKLDELGITKEATAEFKTMLLNRPEIDDIKYDPVNNTYKVKIGNDKKDEKIQESKIEETQNLSRLYQHTKNKDTFAIIGSQDQDTKQDRSDELKSEIGKAQRQYSNVGYNKLEGTYTYENGEQGIEDSYIIYNIPKDRALYIANKLNQESIIWKDSNYFGFIKTDGTEDSQFKNQEKNMTFDEKITDMFGSRFKNGSNRLAFAFECKLIETTDTGINFSKQGKSNIVEYPICVIDVPKSECLEEDVDLNQFAEKCMRELQRFLTNNKLKGADLNEDNEQFMQYTQQNNLEVQTVIPHKIFKVYNFDEDNAGGYIGKLLYTAQGIWNIEVANIDE